MCDTFDRFWSNSTAISDTELNEFFRHSVSGSATLWVHNDRRCIAANGIELRRCRHIGTLNGFIRTSAFSADVSIYERDAAKFTSSPIKTIECDAAKFTSSPIKTIERDAAKFTSSPIKTIERDAAKFTSSPIKTIERDASQRERIENDCAEEVSAQSACRDCGRYGPTCTCHLWTR